MLGDGAVAVHPSDERYAPIVGKLCEIPVGPKEHRRLIPIITDEYPDPISARARSRSPARMTSTTTASPSAAASDVPPDGHQGHMRDDGAPYAEAAAVAQAVAQGQTLSEAEADTLNLVPDDLRGLDRFEARKKGGRRPRSPPRGWP
jgi:valyl-tRNA synthetase